MLVLCIIVLTIKLGLGAAGAKSDVVKEKIRQGATVIDVRTPAEYKLGHYRGATNIPIQEMQNHLPQLVDKKKAVVVYCASGIRSARAAKILTAAGYRDVTNAGGLSNLEP